jgi:hypothetical protein
LALVPLVVELQALLVRLAVEVQQLAALALGLERKLALVLPALQLAAQELLVALLLQVLIALELQQQELVEQQVLVALVEQVLAVS